MARINSKKILQIALFSALSMVCLYLLTAPSESVAGPNREVLTTYYNNANHDVVVGERFILCHPGPNIIWGVQTAYKIVEIGDLCWGDE